jgi:hypothetical protein
MDGTGRPMFVAAVGVWSEVDEFAHVDQTLENAWKVWH